MLAGHTYSIDFYLAFNISDVQGGEVTNVNPNIFPPIDITLFGSNTCSDLPFSGTECPIGQGDWHVLGTVNADPVQLHDNWMQVNITFTPTEDIYAIVLGPPCSLPTEYSINFINEIY
jgi:hypothetical protein